MLLNTNTINIKYLAIDNYYDYTSSLYPTKNNLSEFVEVVDFSEQSQNNFCSHPGYWSSSSMPIFTIKGIYLGASKDIDIEINNRLNPLGPDTFKKVYFDPKCKYPRFKLNSLTNIKRSNDPSKADSVIITAQKFKDYIAGTYVCDKKLKDILILYSPTKDCYYFIDYYPTNLAYIEKNVVFQKIYSKYANPKTEGLYRWSSALINSGVLPEDCKEFYYGAVTLFDNIADTQFINNLFTKYMLLTYDTELDRFISSGLQKPTIEDLDTIRRMISSTDKSVVGLGLKLLSNFDVCSSACAVGILIAQNWHNISSSSVSKSVGFEHVLRSLKINRNTLNSYNVDIITNSVYKVSLDEDDKQKTRKAVIQNITNIMQKDWKAKYAKNFANLDLTFTFTIE